MNQWDELQELLKSGMSLSEVRAFQKQKDRKQDEENFKSGKISREELIQKNSIFAGMKTRIRWDKIRKF